MKRKWRSAEVEGEHPLTRKQRVVQRKKKLLNQRQQKLKRLQRTLGSSEQSNPYVSNGKPSADAVSEESNEHNEDNRNGKQRRSHKGGSSGTPTTQVKNNDIEAARGKAQAEREEARRRKQAADDARRASEHRRREERKRMMQRTPSGQPVMRHRVDKMLSKLMNDPELAGSLNASGSTGNAAAEAGATGNE